jgi:hypothetical protein
MKTLKFFALATISFCLCTRGDEPAIRLVSPEDGAVFTAGESILLQAEPRGAELGAIQKVEFISRAVIGEAASAPFSFTWQGVSPGIYSVSVRATTAAGQVESWKSTIAVLPLDQGRVIYVDKNNSGTTANGSASAPYNNIQKAVDAALNGDTIKVAAGEYSGAVAIVEKNLRLTGGYTGASASVYSQGGSGDFTTRAPRSTLLVGQGADPVVDIDFNGSTQWGIIDGFTISGGKLGLKAHTYEDPTGKYFLLMDNTVTGNSNPANAVAGVAINQVSTAVLSNTISSNTALAYAGLFVDGTASTVGLVKGNLVEGNFSSQEYDHSAGIAFRGKNATGTVTRNIVKNNRAFYGAGIFVDGDVGPNFTRVSFNTVTHNKGFFGTGEFVDGGATAIVENEIIAWNEAINDQFGGAFAVDSGPLTHATLINCTVAYNASFYDEYSAGNGLILSEDEGGDKVSVEVKNCIFWHNAMVPGGKEINAPGAGILKIDFSNIEQSLTATAHLQLGTGVLSADPLFADPQNEDFHLKSKSGHWNPAANGQGAWILDGVDSPCLDAGDPNSIFQKEPVPNGGRINLGAWGNTAEASRTSNGEVPPFGFTNIRLLSGGVPEISAAGPPGRYQVRTASSLDAAQTTWTDLILLTITTGAVTFQDSTSPRTSQRFYQGRLIQ